MTLELWLSFHVRGIYCQVGFMLLYSSSFSFFLFFFFFTFFFFFSCFASFLMLLSLLFFSFLLCAPALPTSHPLLNWASQSSFGRPWPPPDAPKPPANIHSDATSFSSSEHSYFNFFFFFFFLVQIQPYYISFNFIPSNVFLFLRLPHSFDPVSPVDSPHSHFLLFFLASCLPACLPPAGPVPLQWCLVITSNLLPGASLLHFFSSPACLSIFL